MAMVSKMLGLLFVLMSLSVSAHTPYQVGSCHVFKRNSFWLHPACRDVLKFQVVPMMKSRPADEFLLIEGFRAADEKPGIDLKRAKAVAAWLIKGKAGAALDAKRILVEARGVMNDNSQLSMLLVSHSYLEGKQSR